MSLEAELQRLTENDSASRKAAFASAVHESVYHWDEFLRQDPELAKLELAIAHCARILATERFSSPQYAQALAEDRRLRDQRYRLYQARTGVSL